MKKIIFICLLSLSACLSAPAQEGKILPSPPPPNTVAADNTNQTHVKPSEPAVQTPIDNHTPGQTMLPTTNPTTTNITTAQQVQNDNHTMTENTVNKNNTTANEQKTESTVIEKKTETPKDAKSATQAKDVTDKTPTTVKPEEHTEIKNETSTQKMESTTASAKTTEGTKVETEKPEVVLQARGFDGASFVGGIILTMGLIAIGLMGFKYYKAQTERNYHTL